MTFRVITTAMWFDKEATTFLVSGASGHEAGLLYILSDENFDLKIPLIQHQHDTPFFGKSLYPNPFDQKMIIFCDACYGWLHCFVLGPDDSTKIILGLQNLENNLYGEDSDFRGFAILSDMSQYPDHVKESLEGMVSRFRCLIVKGVDDGLFTMQFFQRNGIILGNSGDGLMGQCITGVCYLEENRVLVLAGPINEVVELTVDIEERKFEIERR